MFLLCVGGENSDTRYAICYAHETGATSTYHTVVRVLSKIFLFYIPQCHTGSAMHARMSLRQSTSQSQAAHGTRHRFSPTDTCRAHVRALLLRKCSVHMEVGTPPSARRAYNDPIRPCLLSHHRRIALSSVSPAYSPKRVAQALLGRPDAPESLLELAVVKGVFTRGHREQVLQAQE